MLTTPSILFDAYWVLAISFGIVWLFLLLLIGCDGKSSMTDVWNITQMFLLLIAGFFVLGYVAYFFVAWYYGWKYSIQFIMDDKQVIHEQLKSTVHKARALGRLTAAAGAAAGKPGMIGMGAQAATRTSMATTYDSVRRLVPRRSMNLIKMNERFSRNRIYVPDEDFDFVYEFLCQHCPKARKE